MGRKVRVKKGTVEPLANSPNSLAALLSDREIPKEMDLREIWDRVGQTSHRVEVDSTTRFRDNFERVQRDNELKSTQSSVDLTQQDILRYYELKKGLIQEAFREFYKFSGAESGSEIPKRGCKAIYDEAHLTGSTSILYRKCIHQLMEHIHESKPEKIWIDGKSGSGKSIALLSLVEWARRCHWLVLYLPSAVHLMSDFFYAKRPDSTQYDTIVAAKDILRSVYGVYGGGNTSPLHSLRCTLPQSHSYKFGDTLEDICKTGLDSPDAEVACEATVALLNEILYGTHNVRRLVVMDDYNALYWRSKYFRWTEQDEKEMISAEHLTLAGAFRIFSNTKEVQAHVVAASTYSEGGISPRVQIPKKGPFKSVYIPYASEDEIPSKDSSQSLVATFLKSNEQCHSSNLSLDITFASSIDVHEHRREFLNSVLASSVDRMEEIAG